MGWVAGLLCLTFISSALYLGAFRDLAGSSDSGLSPLPHRDRGSEWRVGDGVLGSEAPGVLGSAGWCAALRPCVLGEWAC